MKTHFILVSPFAYVSERFSCPPSTRSESSDQRKSERRAFYSRKDHSTNAPYQARLIAGDGSDKSHVTCAAGQALDTNRQNERNRTSEKRTKVIQGPSQLQGEPSMAGCQICLGYDMQPIGALVNSSQLPGPLNAMKRAAVAYASSIPSQTPLHTPHFSPSDCTAA